MESLNHTPLITVLIPCYNAMPYLPEALESIMSQTLKNIEILCINDGSTDKTGETLDQYALKDNRIKVEHNKTNLQLISTLNKGVKLAKGDYLARMDADDISLPTRLEKQLKYLEKHKHVDIVSTNKYMISEQNYILTKSLTRNTLPETSLFVSFLYRPIGHPELLGKTSVFKDNPFKKEKHTLHTEDYELWTRLLRKGYQMSNLKEPLYKFRVNQSSVSRKYTGLQDENFVTSANIHYNTFFKDNIKLDVTRVIVNRLIPNIHTKTWLQGIKKIKELRIHFSRLTENKEVKKEIKTVYQTHLLDVCIQSIKHCSFKIKALAVYTVLLNAFIFFNPSVLAYIKSKMYKKQ